MMIRYPTIYHTSVVKQQSRRSDERRKAEIELGRDARDERLAEDFRRPRGDAYSYNPLRR
jgi:hypothetical protein